ncbi:MAG TPA: imidazoleglycerol-phosphate dehydratase [Longimicrobiales bacterium]
MSDIIRETGETRVHVRLDPFAGAEGYKTAIATGEPFLDHMLNTLARYAGWGLEVEAEGDLRHHLVEDVAITLGLALHEEIPETCRRYGDATIVMDDAMVQAALDAGGRFWYQGPLPSALYDHFLRSLAENARITLHVRVLRGRDRHHVVEAAVKAVGLALRDALAAGEAVFSTKGGVRVSGAGTGTGTGTGTEAAEGEETC